jgi:hypothetical protein
MRKEPEQGRPLVVGLTGTRGGMTLEQAATAAAWFAERHGQIRELHHGDCVGVDAEIHDMIREVDPRVWIVGHPPTDGKMRAGCECDQTRSPRASAECIRYVAGESAVVLALPARSREQTSDPVWRAVAYTRNIRKRVDLILPDGTLVENYAGPGSELKSNAAATGVMAAPGEVKAVPPMPSSASYWVRRVLEEYQQRRGTLALEGMSEDQLVADATRVAQEMNFSVEGRFGDELRAACREWLPPTYPWWMQDALVRWEVNLRRYGSVTRMQVGTSTAVRVSIADYARSCGYVFNAVDERRLGDAALARRDRWPSGEELTAKVASRLVRAFREELEEDDDGESVAEDNDAADVQWALETRARRQGYTDDAISRARGLLQTAARHFLDDLRYEFSLDDEEEDEDEEEDCDCAECTARRTGK